MYPLLAALAGQKAHIQLQLVDVDVLQRVQGGIAAAEVVHLHDESAAAQLLHSAHDPLGVLHVGALRHLKVQGVTADTVARHHGVDLIAQVGPVQVLAVPIMGNTTGVFPRPRRAPVNVYLTTKIRHCNTTVCPFFVNNIGTKCKFNCLKCKIVENTEKAPPFRTVLSFVSLGSISSRRGSSRVPARP